MEFILCKICEHGSPAYLQYCNNCNADLSAPFDAESGGANEADSTTAVNFELSDDRLRKNTLTAITMSCLTTLIKVWFLYSQDPYTFMSLNNALFVVSPIVLAVMVAFKSKRWYRILFADSFVVIAAVVVVLFLVGVAAFSK